MPIDIIIEDIRKSLSNDKWLSTNSFGILSKISLVVNNTEYENEGRELVIRALEYRSELSENEHRLLDALVRQVGLFPYLEPDNLSTADLLAYEFHRPLNMDEEDIVFHSAQAKAYRELLSGRNVILSAPTSFGKSLIIDAMIATGKFKNIVIIVPSIALIDETRRRLLKFNNRYKIITHIDQKRAEKNIFVMTQERALIYPELGTIEFFVIDEFYKLNLESDPGRACLLNQIFYKLYKTGAQFYLLGPNIKEVPKSREGKLEFTFIETDFCTVVTETKYINPLPSAEEATLNICKKLKEPTLIYCKSPPSIRDLVKYFLENGLSQPNSDLNDAVSWLSENYHADWLLVHALKSGIGIHHGRLPRSISQYIVKAFNNGLIRFLVCTSTLIEGVNTTAKNVIVYDNKIATKKLDFFTFNNIRGRSGRMFKHFIGKVFILYEEPESDLPLVDFPFITQSNVTPNELLIQLDWNDLSDESKKRIEHIYSQKILDINIIKENFGIDPDSQIEFAEKLIESPEKYHSNLNWKSYPNYDDLEFVSEIIWKSLGGSKKRRSGVESDRQLAYKIWRLYDKGDIKQIIVDEIEKGKDPNEAVEETLDFNRNWAEFHFPRYLRALNKIQEFAFEKSGYEPGNFNFFADCIENMFMPPVVTALEEYGLPSQITLKISDKLSLSEGLDSVLQQIDSLSVNELGLSGIEKQLLNELQKSLRKR